MAPTTGGPVLFPDLAGSPAGVVVLNDHCRLQERDGYRVVSLCGLPVLHFAACDRAGEAYAMVNLVDLGWARQSEVARAFGCDVRTVRRHQRRFEEGGQAALGRPRGFPRGRSRGPQSRKEAVNRWKAEGVSNRKIARRRVAARGYALGFLYVDGHVRAYHGGREVPKTHVARMRISMPATTD